MHIQEGTCYDEHWVLYISHESLNSTLETNTHYMLTIWNLNKKLEKKEIGLQRGKQAQEPLSPLRQCQLFPISFLF